MIVVMTGVVVVTVMAIEVVKIIPRLVVVGSWQEWCSSGNNTGTGSSSGSSSNDHNNLFVN